MSQTDTVSWDRADSWFLESMVKMVQWDLSLITWRGEVAGLWHSSQGLYKGFMDRPAVRLSIFHGT
jgi:hypothetical protein